MNIEEVKELPKDMKSEESDELSHIPVNKSMMEAEHNAMKESAAKKKKKRNRNKKKNKNKKSGENQVLKRERSNTTEEVSSELPQIEEQKELLSINGSVILEDHMDRVAENQNTKDSSDTSAEVDKNHFLTDSKNDADTISEYESQSCVTTREVTYDEIQELFLSEPAWHKSSSWIKPMPHRQYKVKTIWCEVSKFDTEVHRRYRHFLWLREMLIKEYEHWAVPVLPDKTIFERAFTHKSDFIKERMRKMKHFLTLVRSHRKLKQSEYLKTFLCESDQIFRSTIKNLKLLEEKDEKPDVDKNMGWLSIASSSFGTVISKANQIGKNIVPTIKHLLSNPEDDYDAGDLLVKKYSEKLEVLHRGFVDLYKLATQIHEKRGDDCKIESNVHLAFSSLKSTNSEQLTKMISENFEISKVRSEKAGSNLVELAELLYATESHLVWIESVQDLIKRKNALCDNLMRVKEEMKETPLNHHEIESCKSLLDLTERREKMISGIKSEMSKLATGTNDFFPRYVDGKFIQSQLEYYSESKSLFEE